ncbi:cytochrome P450 [Phanerochaete sordida]|uniref:Cytochrome P450 n=1 Tax=Phanerochaete sordida TaxID=48140 RepID=A0A9P3LE78_9APHY|nr:cytochrome P450 [Phanerochaete sordida]
MSVVVPSPLALTVLLCIIFISIATRRCRHNRGGARLPPGPPTLPIVGNLFQLPRKNMPRGFMALGRQYGPIFHMRTLSRHIIVVNDVNIARTLFEKRGAIYSHRPRMVMSQEVIKRETLLFMNYGPEFKKTRKLLSTFLNPRIASQYWATQEIESLKFVLKLHRSPKDALKLARWTTTSLIIRLMYGIEVKDEEDDLVSLAEEFAQLTAESTRLGKWLVDSLPILLRLPIWAPGAGFKRWAMRAKARMEEFSRVPYAKVKANIAAGEIVQCWITDKLMENTGRLTTQDEKDISNTATAMYAGGSDTTNATVSTFILLMLHYPEVQKKAQAEIDRVTGSAWVPGMRERELFPYVNCVIKELLRFNPIVPLLPHSLHEDDVFEGYLIPKGSWVLANLWAFMHDEAKYPLPEVFMPERFEAGEGKEPREDPTDTVFGFGRRSCPGYLLALASLHLNVIHLLFAFDIVPAKDDAGNVVLPPIEFVDAHVAHPKPFVCDIRERSPEKIALLEHVLHSLQ